MVISCSEIIIWKQLELDFVTDITTFYSLEKMKYLDLFFILFLLKFLFTTYSLWDKLTFTRNFYTINQREEFTLLNVFSLFKKIFAHKNI